MNSIQCQGGCLLWRNRASLREEFYFNPCDQQGEETSRQQRRSQENRFLTLQGNNKMHKSRVSPLPELESVMGELQWAADKDRSRVWGQG